MTQGLAARRWDAEYRSGRYADDPPLPFVAEILATLDEHPALRDGVGLYVGCGNGRNYLPLVDAGLRLTVSTSRSKRCASSPRGGRRGCRSSAVTSAVPAWRGA